MEADMAEDPPAPTSQDAVRSAAPSATVRQVIPPIPPVASVAPVPLVTPVVPVSTVVTVAPVAPGAPGASVAPVAPVTPVEPVEPVEPVAQVVLDSDGDEDISETPQSTTRNRLETATSQTSHVQPVLPPPPPPPPTGRRQRIFRRLPLTPNITQRTPSTVAAVSTVRIPPSLRPTMQALTMVPTEQHGVRKIKYEASYTRPDPGQGEVLIKVRMAGICGTDLEMLQGYKEAVDKLVLGHEFVGEVAAFGPDCPPREERLFDIGHRVVSELNCVPHGSTTSRNAYERAQDDTRTTLGIFKRDGAFAEYVVTPYINIHRVPDGVPTRVAVFTEPIAAACQILQEVMLPPTDTIGILGAGKLGWVIAKVLSAAGKQVEVLARHPTSCFPDFIRKWGPNDEQLIPIVSLPGRHPATPLRNTYAAIVDCTGSPLGLGTAIQLVKPRGTIILKSTHSADAIMHHRLDLSPLVVKEIKLIGSRCGPFDVALRFLRNGLLDVDSLITEVYGIADGEAAFQRAGKRGVLKVLIQF